MTIHRISPTEAQAKLLDGWTYVDVRTPDEFGDGHPAGAINIPIALSNGGTMWPNPDFVSVLTAHVGEARKIILGCQSGGRSMRAAQALEKAGFGELFEQRAGWDGARDAFGQVVEPGWKRAGLPSETGQPEGRSWTSLQGLARK